MLESFCRQARQIVEAQEAAVGIFEPDSEKLRYFFRCDAGDDLVASNGIPKPAQRALKRLIKARRPLRFSEFDEPLQITDERMGPVRSFLGAPIFSATRICGWVYLLNCLSGTDFTEADERLAATLATQVAIAYENAKLYSEAQMHATELQAEIVERQQAEEERALLLVREQAARAEAEQANQTKDEFLATLSHELRTPLTAILGWSHLLRSGKLETNQLERALETIERNARSQSQLIDDLLDVSRIITGKLQIEPVSVDLCSVIEVAIDGVRPSAEPKGIELITSIPESACMVRGDANRLQQVFWNLLSNAIKFTPENGQVRVDLKAIGSDVSVSVSDTGVGIKPEFLPFIFDRFRQADGSTTRVHGGLGLGLSIVKHLVQLHGGLVKVESDGQNHGTTFTIELPLSEVVDKEQNGDSNHGSTVDLSLARPGFARLLDHLRIVVVDDEADSRELIKAILVNCGGEVTCCENVPEAMKAIREWKPDLLVSDIGMPNEDGYSLIAKVRNLRSKRARQLPAVALTAYATKEDKAKALSNGFQIHVTKPIEPENLVMSIASAIGRKM